MLLSIIASIEKETLNHSCRVLHSCLESVCVCVCVRPIYPLESAVTDEVVELAARWLVDINKRTNAGYHGRCGQLCYYCTTAKCLQATLISKLVKTKNHRLHYKYVAAL